MPLEKTKYYLLHCLICIPLYLQAIPVTVRQVPIMEQLPSNTIQRIYQDKEGYIWLGTLDGLCRYDGYRIVLFRSDMNNPNLLTNNEITCIAEDNNHLWIGTKEGVNILDKKTYQIHHFKDNSIQNQEIKYILVSSDSSIWVGAGNEVFRYNPDFSLKSHYYNNSSDPNSLPNAPINSIYEDLSGNIWILTWRSGLLKYNPIHNNFTRYPTIGTDDNPFRIFQDNRKQYWICTWKNGLYLFNPEKKPDSMYSQIETKDENRHLTESIFYSIIQDDAKGYIWALSYFGLFTFEYTENGSIRKVDISGSFKDTNNLFSEIIKDKDGNLWIGAFSEGAFTVSFDRPVIQNYPLEEVKKKTGINPSVTAIYEDNSGTIWANLNRYGLCFINPETNNIQLQSEFPELEKKGNSFGFVYSMTGFHNSEEVWVGKEVPPTIVSLRKNKNGFIVSDQVNQYLEKLPWYGNASFFSEDKNKNRWIITNSGILIKPFDKDTLYLVTNEIRNITGITEDSDGNVWISSRNSGIYKIPPYPDNINKAKIINYSKSTGDLKTNNIQAICADANGQVWLGTKDGSIIVYDIKKNQFTDMSNACAMTGEAILNILVDDYQHIWISTNKKITEYNPVNQGSTYYTSSDGILVNSFLINACYKSKTGKIFFGGNRGLCSFTPSERLSKPAGQSKVVITDIKIQNSSVFYGNHNVRFDNQNKHLTLKPNEKNIEIVFSTLNYISPSKIQYVYKLDGVDNNWVYAGNNRQFATYNQLRKGHYLFRVKATDENGLWNEEETLLSIYRKPAFYETWWAFLSYAFIIFISVFAGLRFYINRVKLRNELKIAQIDKEKSEELTQTKLRYFTNISHDLLTPLTIISCLIDDIESRYGEKITQHTIMRSNINRLKRLLQQVLDFRKMESGNMKLKIGQGDIAVFIKNICYTNFSPLIEKKKIKFSFISQTDNIPAFFDSDKIDKILFNLLSNAFKYTNEEGSIQVILEKREENSQTSLIIKVSDTGKGISNDALPHIFTRFFYNESILPGESNGVGLSLTKDLVELHHGIIQVESQLNEGTTFTVLLPISRNNYSENELSGTHFATNEEINEIQEEKTTESKELTPDSKEDVQILIVEDNEELRILISSIFAKRYHVLSATNGKEGLDIVQNNKIDIVVSDIMMPEMDGLELCRKLKSDLETSHISVLLLTAKNSIEDRIECYNAGADGYISKPFDLKVLKARIDNLVNNKKNRQKEFKSDLEINISTLEYPSLDESFLEESIHIIEQHLSQSEFDVIALSENMNMSKSTFYRKIKSLTGLSPAEFIRNIRLKHACQMLKNKSNSIADVAYSVGFSDPKYFSSSFKNEFGMTPSEYQKNNQ